MLKRLNGPVIYVYERYGVFGSSEQPNLRRLLSQARYDSEYNEAFPYAIAQEGRVVADWTYALQRHYWAIFAPKTTAASCEVCRRIPARLLREAEPAW